MALLIRRGGGNGDHDTIVQAKSAALNATTEMISRERGSNGQSHAAEFAKC
jgi:hypothetical protein